MNLEIRKRAIRQEIRALGGRRRRSRLPARVRFEVLRRDRYRCTYCGRQPRDGAILQVDHVVPRSKGGTDNFSNLRTACSLCNGGKSDLPA